MDLAKRDGVDVRPTLLRVLTDLYVQSPVHSADEEAQFVELATRLIERVDDATRAAVRARLSIYPRAPLAIMRALAKSATETAALPRAQFEKTAQPTKIAQPVKTTAAPPTTPDAVQNRDRTPAPPDTETADAPRWARSGFTELFMHGKSPERAQMLRNLNYSTLAPAVRIERERSGALVAKLESAAFAADRRRFADELANGLGLPAGLAHRIAEDTGGEALLCVGRALGMSIDSFQRIALLLNPAIGTSVERVFTLSRMYESVSERVALIMLAAWRGQSRLDARPNAPLHGAQPARHQPALYDEGNQRAKPRHIPSPPLAPAPARPAADSMPTFGQRAIPRS
jgi:hypothetical protein